MGLWREEASPNIMDPSLKMYISGLAWMSPEEDEIQDGDQVCGK